MSGNGNTLPGALVKATVSLATLTSLTLLGLVLAYWTWQWFAPVPEPRAVPGTETVSRTSSADALFGKASVEGNAAARTAGSAIRLLGVAAASGKHRGHAVFQVDGKKSVVVEEGGDILSGVGLAEVHADHVVLDRKGVREKLPLPRK